ncbi:replication protein [Zooshikella ganghwensis]|uniref:Bacteriophage lambda Replication protein O N-terminal domain-containing protein n=1 Tax=Zooshikella ganghwensis TaxID=202772 RepID=A0A4P9VEE0_9GAMM|nr:replication protein [Zooshikella ganghwensis]RDH41425.1 hypothetical protein B9G39_28625 [Zooshikella ganghwensis]
MSILSFPAVNDVKNESQEVQLIKPVNNYTQYANELTNAFVKLDISGRQLRVLFVIARKTIGFDLKTDWISASQIARAMDYEGGTTHINADIRELKKRNILYSDGRKVGINPFLSEWVYSKQSDRKQSPKRPKTVRSKTQSKVTEISQGGDRKRSEKETENGHHKINKQTKPTNTTTTSRDDSKINQLNSVNSEHPIFSKKPPTPVTRKNPNHPMTMDWQPDWKILATNLHMLGIPIEFAHEILPEFRTYWIEEGVTRRWQSSFLSRVQSQWVRRQAQQNATSNAQPVSTKPKNACKPAVDFDDTSWIDDLEI